MTKQVHEAVEAQVFVIFERLFLVFYTFFVSSDSHRILHPENWGKDAAKGSKIREHFRATYAPHCTHYSLLPQLTTRSVSRCCDFARKWRILTPPRALIFESRNARESVKLAHFDFYIILCSKI